MEITCSACSGTGTYDDESCARCGGDGARETIGILERLDAYLLAHVLPTNVFRSHAIWEATDSTEYQALTEAQQENYNKIVHMGTVDLNVGTTSRAVLWNLFDSESTTRTALLALLT